MDLFSILFYFFAIFTVVAAGIVVFSRHLVRAAFALLFAFVGVAGLYVFLLADFIAITQLMVYVGGILVLVIFGVMLTQKQISVDIKTSTMQIVPATLLTGGICGWLVWFFATTDWVRGGELSPETTATTPVIGQLLLTKYLLPFEIASIVLLVALIGAVMIARREKKA